MTSKILSVFLFCFLDSLVISFQRPNLFRFGIIADVQYADCDDSYNFQETHIRRYRQSREILREAVGVWDNLNPELTCAISLGDLLDGKTAMTKTQKICLDELIGIIRNGRTKFHYCFGNHDYYAVDILINPTLL